MLLRTLPVAFLLAAGSVFPQASLTDRDERVIRYRESRDLTGPVHALASDLSQLEFRGEQGYLASLLRLLHVPVSSQGLVFSKTSMQAPLISPQTPRALYFSDSVYVGWVPGSEVIEISEVDAQKGPIFYTLDQRAAGPPRLRRREECMQCHFALKTLGVPGFLMNSMLTAPNGSPIAPVEGFTTGHRAPLNLRFSGWYVTGTSTPADHSLGNSFVADKLLPQETTYADPRIDASKYLSTESDLVALMVLSHQVRMHNLITRLNYETRLSLAEQRTSVVDASPRIANAAEQLLEYMLFRDEAPLHGPMKGTTPFSEEFARGGPSDAKGRSLRQLDLSTRLLRYPCSFLIYSEAFDHLPFEAKSYLWRRLFEILNGRDHSKTYSTLNSRDRQGVLDILRETKPEFSAWIAAHQR